MATKRHTTKLPRSVRWTGSNYDFAKKLAEREHRSLNAWLNLTVERLYVALRANDTMQ